MKDYTQCPNELITDMRLSAADLRVFLFIARNADNFRYTIRQACQSLGISKSSWLRSISVLEQIGAIKSIRSGGAKINKYIAVPRSKTETPKVSNEDHSRCQTETIKVSNEDHYGVKREPLPPYNNKKNVTRKTTSTTYCAHARADDQSQPKDEVAVEHSLTAPQGGNQLDEGARARRKFRTAVYDQTLKRINLMKANGIYDEPTYFRIAETILNEWEVVETPPDEVNWRHFMNVFRYKAQDYKKNETSKHSSTQQQAADLRESTAQLVAGIIAAGRTDKKPVP